MQLRAVVLFVALPLVLSACEKPKSAEEQARDDARAIAMVEAAQHVAPPPVPLDPQPITAADIEQNKLYGVGCTLVPADQPGGNPLVVATDKRAVIKLGSRFVTFAADAGSPPLALGARTHYVGKAQSLLLEKASGDGTRLGEESFRWDGTLTLRDAHEQLVFTSSGAIVCGG